jgi:hypothetical protein
VCNKCGEIHHHHQMVAQFQAAQQPEQPQEATHLRDLLKRIRQWDALDIPDSDGAYWKREIDAALEQPEQEPVAWACFKNGELQTELVGTEADVDFWCASDEPEMEGMVKGALYTHPPRREWQSLSEEEFGYIYVRSATHEEFARAVEAALRSKNHGIYRPAAG